METRPDVDVLEQYAALVENSKRAEQTAELVRLLGLANTAEKWRGIAQARHGDGRTVAEIEREASAPLLAAIEALQGDLNSPVFVKALGNLRSLADTYRTLSAS